MQAKDLKPGAWLTRDGDSLLYMSLGVGSDGLLYVGYRSGGDFQVGWFGPGEEVTHHPDCTGWDWPIPKRVKLEVGKRYVMRYGAVTPQIERNGANQEYPFSCDIGQLRYTWTEYGQYHIGTPSDARDIVSEYVEPEPAIDPGEGWRLLEDDEAIKQGDEFHNAYGLWLPVCFSIGETPSTNRDMQRRRAFRRRIEPVYVPFTQETFKPHRDRWIVRKDGKHVTGRIEQYDDEDVMSCGVRLTYEKLLELCEFEDGDVCGVKQ